MSVLIVTWNRKEDVLASVQSVYDQAYQNFEVVIVDNDSNDGTVEIIRDYGNRVKWVYEPDKVHAGTINKGWLMSKGEILSWFNANDLYVLPDAIS